ncbi:uncharacterized protein PG986_000413 [Apiospora aurea]|uniref:Pheromone n=1 Tax=Apiospora aurea TaxID=335848 RepID=A0ABR1QUZ8_9PEZI
MKQQFNAAAPGDLRPFYAVPDDGEPVATQPTMGTSTSERGTSPTSSHVAPNAPSSTTLVSTSSDLPAGAAAGIGVGAGAATNGGRLVCCLVRVSSTTQREIIIASASRSRKRCKPTKRATTASTSLYCIWSGSDPSEPRQIPQELEHAGNGPNELPT